jgi:hypothetical protein
MKLQINKFIITIEMKLIKIKLKNNYEVKPAPTSKRNG